MTHQDHVRIAQRFLDRGTVTAHDRAILRAAQPLTTPFANVLNEAVREKVDHLVADAKATNHPAQRHFRKVRIRNFAHSPLGAAFIKS